MHFKMLSAVCFNLDQSKILLSGKKAHEGMKLHLTDTHQIFKNGHFKVVAVSQKYLVLHCCPPCHKYILFYDVYSLSESAFRLDKS